MPMREIKLNAKFYDLISIDQAVKDYSYLGDIKIKKIGNYFVVLFDKFDNDLREVVANEFANYVLAQVVKKR